MSTDEARRVSGGGQPIIDGWIIPEDLSLTFANGKQQPVDVIVGFNKDDLVLSTAANTRTRDVMAWHMRLFAEKQTQIGKKAFFYTFTHEGPLEPGAPRQGAAHASEIAYVFQTLDKPRIIPDRTSPKLASDSAKDIAMADQISSYWVNFAKNGNPNGKGCRSGRCSRIATHRRTSSAKPRSTRQPRCSTRSTPSTPSRWRR